MKTKKELHIIRYVFDEDEKRLKATQLAETCSEKTRLAEEKKSVVSDYKAKIDAKDSTISLLSSHITNGYEHKSVECEVKMLFDVLKKEYWYKGKLYDTVPMSPEDTQLKIEDEKVKVDILDGEGNTIAKNVQF